MKRSEKSKVDVDPHSTVLKICAKNITFLHLIPSNPGLGNFTEQPPSSVEILWCTVSCKKSSKTLNLLWRKTGDHDQLTTYY